MPLGVVFLFFRGVDKGGRMLFEHEEFLKIAFAVLAGGLIGFEREFRDKAAGLRTLIFICVGSTVFTILSWKIADARDPRIAATIVSGIGFLGAGVILRDRGRIVGITTAATIWLTAALGMAIGGGFYTLAINLLGASLIVLWFFPRIEAWISRAWEEKNYEIVCVFDNGRESQLRADFERHGLQVTSYQQKKVGDTLYFFWRAGGRRKNHEQLMRHLVSSPEIKEFNV